jgi:replicative DNA helicase
MIAEEDENLFQKLKSGAVGIDELITHEKHISQVDPSTFRIVTVPSGFPSLDEYMFLKDQRGELVVVGARPSMGKSAFIFQMAYNVASVGQPVHIFSMEMDKESVVSRLVAGHINRSITAIQNGVVPDGLINQAHRELSNLPYFIDDRAGLSIDDIYEAAIQANLRHGTKLIVIDYLQLIKGRQMGTRDQQITEITGTLKALARELKIPVLTASQLNRGCEQRGASSGDYRPLISDLRESGGIEQDADIIALLFRESYYNKDNRPGEADIIVAKNRNGATGTVTLDFTQQQTKFIDRKKYSSI